MSLSDICDQWRISDGRNLFFHSSTNDSLPHMRKTSLLSHFVTDHDNIDIERMGLVAHMETVICDRITICNKIEDFIVYIENCDMC